MSVTSLSYRAQANHVYVDLDVAVLLELLRQRSFNVGAADVSETSSTTSTSTGGTAVTEGAGVAASALWSSFRVARLVEKNTVQMDVLDVAAADVGNALAKAKKHQRALPASYAVLDRAREDCARLVRRAQSSAQHVAQASSAAASATRVGPRFAASVSRLHCVLLMRPHFSSALLPQHRRSICSSCF